MKSSGLLARLNRFSADSQNLITASFFERGIGPGLYYDKLNMVFLLVRIDLRIFFEMFFVHKCIYRVNSTITAITYYSISNIVIGEIVIFKDF